MNERVELTALTVTRRNDQRVLRALAICTSDDPEPVLRIGNLNNSSFTLEVCRARPAFRVLTAFRLCASAQAFAG